MENEEDISTIECCSSNVTFSVDDSDYTGTILNIGRYGVSVSVDGKLLLPKGKKIHMTFDDKSKKDVKSAEVAWSDLSGFGAKFI
ncbi:MAG: PilZ domain-containing protein [Desulfobacterales bacterium]|nr:PilZ domain-containing protein [Desulfobacterales bacterium]